MKKRSPPYTNLDVVRALREETGLTIEKCQEIYDSLFCNVIPSLLLRDKTLVLPHFGKLDLILTTRAVRGVAQADNVRVAVTSATLSKSFRRRIKELEHEQE